MVPHRLVAQVLCQGRAGPLGRGPSVDGAVGQLPADDVVVDSTSCGHADCKLGDE